MAVLRMVSFFLLSSAMVVSCVSLLWCIDAVMAGQQEQNGQGARHCSIVHLLLLYCYFTIVATMDEFINENEEISLPLEPSPHLRHANANDIIEWLIDNDQDDEALGTFPTVWRLLEVRIRDIRMRR
jgi:hypothetical protein